MEAQEKQIFKSAQSIAKSSLAALNEPDVTPQDHIWCQGAARGGLLYVGDKAGIEGDHRAALTNPAQSHQV